MKEVPIEKKRNVCLAGHNGCGKTSLLESLLFYKGAIDRLGRPEDGSTFSDYSDEEKQRHVSIHTSLASLTHQNHQITLLDLPGYADFVAEVRGGMRVSDAAILVIAADAGVQVETEKVWKYSQEFDIPALAFINKMDRENADFDKSLQSIQENFKVPVVVLQFPIGKESGFKGVVDIISMKAITFNAKGGVDKTEDIPADLQDQANEYREKLVDSAAEQDEAVMEKYLEGTALTDAEINAGLALGISNRSFVPVMCGSATKCIGMESLINAIVSLLPSPMRKNEIVVHDAQGKETKIKVSPDGDLCAYIWKTAIDPYAGRLSFFRVYSGALAADSSLYNTSKKYAEKVNGILEVNGKSTKVMTRATAGDIGALAKLEHTETGDTLAPANKGYLIPPTDYPPHQVHRVLHAVAKADEEKLGGVISRIVEEDQTIRLKRNQETNELVISGMGDLHLNVVCERLRRQFGVNTELKIPKIAYRETVTVKGEGSYRHKKQSGGRGQFGEVHIRLEPNPNAGFEFLDEIVGGVISGRFIPAVEKGVVERMKKGILAGYPVVDVKVALFYGKMHDVDSSEMAFKIAGSMGFKEVAQKCKPIMLEPILNAEIVVPEEYMGDIIGDLNSKRGRIMGMESVDGQQHIKAQIPEAEMHSYSTDLRSIARGRGFYTTEFAHYEQVPGEIASKLIAGAKIEEDEE